MADQMTSVHLATPLLIRSPPPPGPADLRTQPGGSTFKEIR
jgi:hypothetical protein